MVTKLDEWKFGKTRGIKRLTLKRDIARGVKFLNEQAYSNIWGSTKSSALFCMALRKYIDFETVYRVDLMHSQRHWYTVRLHTTDGYVVQLKGFSFGYYGEGSRGTLAVLQECGFSAKQIHRIFKLGLTKLRMFRRVS